MIKVFPDLVVLNKRLRAYMEDAVCSSYNSHHYHAFGKLEWCGGVSAHDVMHLRVAFVSLEIGT